jgi:hypothetical protein
MNRNGSVNANESRLLRARYQFGDFALRIRQRLPTLRAGNFFVVDPTYHLAGRQIQHRAA